VDFAFSDEQNMLRASARELIRDRYPVERVAAIADGDGFDRGEWGALADLGWAGISVPEDEGGAGLSFFDEIVVVEELGRGLYPGPFVSTVVMALPLLRLAGAGEQARAIASGERTATVAWAGEAGTWDVEPAPKVTWEGERLSAVKVFVPDLAAADVVVVVGGLAGGMGVWLVEGDMEGVMRRELPSVDATRRQGELVLDGAPAQLVATLAPRHLAGIRDRALAALSVEAVGVGQAALEMGIEHARTRVQFGKAIGAYQAVSHQLAQAFLEIETARSLAYWAAWAVAEGQPEAPAAAAAAKGRAAEAAVGACERAIQVSGGLGFTWEHPLHRWYKRALGISATFGWGAEQRRRVAAAILD
jgi:alkylation response protein AidB-like acyl-CoA dehydrogenase